MVKWCSVGKEEALTERLVIYLWEPNVLYRHRRLYNHYTILSFYGENNNN